MTLTRYGFREWGSALLAAMVVWGLCYWLVTHNWPRTGWGVGAAVLVLFLAFAAFFRNPWRKLPGNPLVLVSPADGRIRDIETVEDFDLPPFKGKALRIGIFLSVLDVHVNRAPAELLVENVHYREGEYLDARDGEATKRNEAMTVSGTATVDDIHFPMAVRQISGAIARRIVCPVKPGRTLRRGEIYGMIKFGSRTELYLPPDRVSVNVKVGDRVYGGSSVLATVTE